MQYIRAKTDPRRGQKNPNPRRAEEQTKGKQTYNRRLCSATVMADLPEMFPPSKLGEYTVIQDIAEGTFGKVKSLSSLSYSLSPSPHVFSF